MIYHMKLDGYPRFLVKVWKLRNFLAVEDCEQLIQEGSMECPNGKKTIT